MVLDRARDLGIRTPVFKLDRKGRLPLFVASFKGSDVGKVIFNAMVSGEEGLFGAMHVAGGTDRVTAEVLRMLWAEWHGVARLLTSMGTRPVHFFRLLVRGLPLGILFPLLLDICTPTAHECFGHAWEFVLRVGVVAEQMGLRGKLTLMHFAEYCMEQRHGIRKEQFKGTQRGSRLGVTEKDLPEGVTLSTKDTLGRNVPVGLGQHFACVESEQIETCLQQMFPDRDTVAQIAQREKSRGKQKVTDAGGVSGVTPAPAAVGSPGSDPEGGEGGDGGKVVGEEDEYDPESEDEDQTAELPDGARVRVEVDSSEAVHTGGVGSVRVEAARDDGQAARDDGLVSVVLDSGELVRVQRDRLELISNDGGEQDDEGGDAAADPEFELEVLYST